jgi:uncharacterized protein YceK
MKEKKMKKILFIIMVVFALGMFASCNKAQDLEEGQYEYEKTESSNVSASDEEWAEENKTILDIMKGMFDELGGEMGDVVLEFKVEGEGGSLTPTDEPESPLPLIQGAGKDKDLGISWDYSMELTDGFMGDMPEGSSVVGYVDVVDEGFLFIVVASTQMPKDMEDILNPDAEMVQINIMVSLLFVPVSE